MSDTFRDSAHRAPRPNDERLRLRVLAMIFAASFALVAIRLIDLMPAPIEAEAAIGDAASGLVADREAREAARAAGERIRRRPVIADRHGDLLAADLLATSVYGDPYLMRDPQATARQLASVLSGVEAEAIAERFAAGTRFAWVKHHITPAEQAAILELGLPGVGFEFGEHRVYPKGNLASHVLGFVDVDNRGLAGIEYSLDKGLLPIDPASFAGAGDGPLEAEAIALSLDTRLQAIAAEETDKAVRRFRAQGACSLVMDVETGELLAFVSLPDFDPNHAGSALPDQRLNRCSGGSFELGSMFKVVSHALALDKGAVGLDDVFDTTEPLKIGRHRIRDEHGRKRPLTVPEIFMHSSNIGTAKMVFAAGGTPVVQEFLDGLGLTARQPLEIPERASPQLPVRWPDVTTATVSFGHGIAVTPLQFVSSIATLLGDGRSVSPTLLRRDSRLAAGGPRIISAETTELLRFLMWLTVAEGSGSAAASKAYAIGGKTGTADKVDPAGGYMRDQVIASFVGVFPIQAPRFAVLTMLDNPKGDADTHGYRYGGWTAAPVVGRIIDRSGPLLGIEPDAARADLEYRSWLELSQALNGWTRRMETRYAARRPDR